MSLDAWILALHLLSAVALVGAMTIFSIGMLALRGVDRPQQVATLAPMLRVASVAVLVGVLGTIVFGIWLALSIDGYAIWDGWVLAAIILWVIGTETGRRSGAAMGAALSRSEKLVAEGKLESDPELAMALRNPQARLLHWISTATILLVLVDMIWKPGA